MIAVAEYNQKYDSALRRIVLSGLIAWDITLTEKASVDSKATQKSKNQKKSNAVPHIISRKQSAQQLIW